jgi:excisionase family DNA binding protein
METALVSATQAADRLGVSRQMVTRWCRLGILAAQKVGATWAIDAASVEALRARREEGKS